MAEIIDLCDSEDDLKRSQSDLDEVTPPKKQRVVVELESEPGSSPRPYVHPDQSQVQLKYTAHIRGKPKSGVFEQPISENFERFFSVFTSDLDDLLVEIDGLPVPWYGTPEMAFDDGPLSELEVDVRSRSAPDDDASAPEEEEDTLVTVKINSPRGRWNVNVKKSLTIGKIAASVAQKYGVEIEAIRAEFDGDEVNFDDTIQGLDIEDEDIIDFIWKTER